MNKKMQWMTILLTAITPMLWGLIYLVTTEFSLENHPFTTVFLRALHYL